MRILITGGSGFIGSKLVSKLKAEHDIVVFTRSPHAVQQKLNVKTCHDIQTIDFNDIDAVINLAGEPIADKRWTQARKSQLQQSRWQLTEQLVTAINQCNNPPKTFISASAIGYYGRQYQPVTEDFQGCHPEYAHYLCKKWEKAAQSVNPDTRLCILRIGVVLGEAGGALEKMALPFKLGLGGPIGDGKQVMSWVYMNDLINMIEKLLIDNTLSGVFNGTAPNAVTNEEFSRQLAKKLHRPNLLRMPTVMAKLMFGEMSDILLYGQDVKPKRFEDINFTFECATLDRALASITHL